MLRIYAIPVSLYCAKLRILLRHKRLAWEEIPPPGGYGSDEYKTHVPSGNLPALMDGHMVLADSEAIAEYLEERHPNPAMLPVGAAARAKARERGRFHDTRLEPAVRALFPHLPGREPMPEGAPARHSAEITARLGQLAEMLGDGAGTDLTLGDCGLPVTFAWIEALTPALGLKIGWPDAITAYRARLDQHLAVADELADYRPKLAAFLGG